MNTRPQITIVEPMIRIPDWRSVSPKNFRTRRLYTWRIDAGDEFADLAGGGEPFAR